MPLLVSGQTHIGLKRNVNQDTISLNHKIQTYLVCDGMGGHLGGEVASQMARDEIVKYIKECDEEEEAVLMLKNAVKRANQAIFEHAQKNSDLEGMGTTVVLLYFEKDTLYIASVGDSRAYLIHREELFQLTKDHSLVQEKINLGLYGRDQAQTDQSKNVLTRTVGFEKDVDVDVYNYKINKGDLFLMCSDGLYGMLSERHILYLINKSLGKLKKTDQETLNILGHQLVEAANDSGGDDNISVILAMAN